MDVISNFRLARKVRAQASRLLQLADQLEIASNLAEFMAVLQQLGQESALLASRASTDQQGGNGNEPQR